MKKWGEIILNWLVVLFWMGVIYYFSDQPNLKSELEPIWDLVFRKIAHMAEYFVLAYLLFRACNKTGFKPKRSLVYAVFFSLTYAISDEYHQSLVGGRTASPVDVFVDSLGIFGFIILNIIKR